MSHLHANRSKLLAILAVATTSLVLAPNAWTRSFLHPTTPSASQARTTSLNETGRLHLISKHGFTLYEQGPASGTVTGTIYVRLRIVSTSRVTAEVSIAPHGGSISGVASARYHKGTTSATFSGSLSITHGTGSYAHAHGSNLSFSGTIQRSNDAITTHVGGTVSE